MKKLLLLLVPLGQTILGHGPHGVHGQYHDHSVESGHNQIPSILEYYDGDFKDTDEDGMTDSSELEYGYNPNSFESFPAIDFISELSETSLYTNSQSIDTDITNDLRFFVHEKGITLLWDYDQVDSFMKYYLVLNNGDQQIYYGGHSRTSAEINYNNFSLRGDELLTGFFMEYDTNRNWLGNTSSFTIDLSKIEIPKKIFGDQQNKIMFHFENFTDEQQSKYVNFLQRVLPIMRSLLGPPSESFICNLVMQDGSSSSWITYDRGRRIHLDSDWNPRLFVHELIHVWDGSLGFTWSGPNREYSDDLSGFAEIAEGLAYKILHKFVSAYPSHQVSKTTSEGGAWNNWTSDAWSYDLYKHHRFTGAGNFWTHDRRTVNHRYSIAGMLIKIILVNNPNFIKNAREELFEIVNENPSKIMSRDDIINLWVNHIEEINGIDARTYLNKMPVLNGHNLEQGFYPILNIRDQWSLPLFSSYVLDGQMWWSYITNDNYNQFNIPSWVKHTYNHADGYYYLDVNNMRVDVTLSDVWETVINSSELITDNTYQDENRIIPNRAYMCFFMKLVY